MGNSDQGREACPDHVGQIANKDHNDEPWCWRWAELMTLSAFAFAQPLYAVFGEHPTFLVAHELSGIRLVAFALALTFVPASGLIVVDEFVRLAPAPAAGWMRVLLRGALFGLILGPPATRAAGIDGVPEIGVVLMAATVGVVLFIRFDVTRRVVRFAVFAVPLFVGAFLFVSPAAGLLRNGDAEVVGTSGAEKTSVVWLVFDQLPLALLVDDDGDIIDDRFPGFARLAASSTWYPRATTVASSTNLSMTSALSGRFADWSGLPVASQVPVNLFTLLAGTHDVHALENVTQLCPQTVCGHVAIPSASETHKTVSDTWVVLMRTILSDAVADNIVPEMNDRWSGFGAEEINGALVNGAEEATTKAEIRDARSSGDDRARFEAFIDALGTSDGPGLHYLHLEKPHEPLLFVPDGRIYDRCSCYAVTADGRWPKEPAMTRQRLQRYLLQTMYVDGLIERVLDRLEETGMVDDTLVVVMSDHGASMLPGTSNRTLTSNNADELLPVPLFVRYPGQVTSAVDKRVAQLTDILPTLADVLQIDLDDDRFDGRSLVADRVPQDATEVITRDGTRRLEREPSATASAYVDWLVTLFPDPANPWAHGPVASLVGTTPKPVGTSRLTASMANTTRLNDVDLDSGYVPAHLIGELHGADRPVELVVAVNGTIAGVGTTFWNELWRISLMVDPTYLVEGKNIVEFYEVTKTGLMRIETQ